MGKPVLEGVSADKLKQDVSVMFTDDKACIAYALWEIALPMDWLLTCPEAGKLLARRMTRSEALTNPAAGALVRLLDAQGCFTPIAKPSYTLREVKAMFDPLRSQWYADYYAHPAWQHLRSGQASRNGLLAWLIHNYHISRAAGIVAARMAALGRHAAWTGFFRQDALDEYWHCDAYYALDTPLLQDIGLERIKAYLPLPASLAFEAHTLQLAEHDALAHLLIAYFQESSIAFEDDCRDFYRTVEQQYRIPGLFQPWQQHIQIDVQHGHATGLGQLLESDAEISHDALDTALRQAWLAFYFLCRALDDILLQHRDASLDLRQPPAAPAGVHDLQHLLEAHLGNTEHPGTIAARECAALHLGLCASAFRALGFARRHDDIVACGRWAQALSRVQPNGGDLHAAGPWSTAIVQQLHEMASHPAAWRMLAALLAERVPALQTGGEQGRLRACAIHPDAAAQLLQLDELIARCATSRDRVPVDLLWS